MSPITARATQLSVLRYHVQQLTTLLSKLDQGLRLCGIDPEKDVLRRQMVDAIRAVHGKIGALMCSNSVVASQMYADNRGLTP